NVDILVAGPVQVGGGEILSLDVSVQNNNKTGLELVNLFVEYPDGTKSSLDMKTDLKRQTETLGDIPVYGYVKKNIKAVLYGEEGSKKQIKVSVDYRISGSNAVFEKDKIFDIEISSSPVSVIIDGPAEIQSGKDFVFKIGVTSNSNNLLKNISLKADYPPGFSFGDSNPKTISGNNIWSLGDLAVGDVKSITVSGRLEGQDSEEKVFKFSVGTADEKDSSNIGTIFTTLSQSLTIKKPFLDAKLVIGGESNDVFAVQAGQSIQTDIVWSNNLQTKVIDPEIKIKFSGNAVDKTSISSETGFYNSSLNEIVWNKTTDPANFTELSSGSNGRAGFRFSTALTSSLNPIKNPEITMTISIKGNQFAEPTTPQEISSVVSKKIRVVSNAKIIPRLVYSTGPFENSGPIPPKVEKETTYTVIWAITNPTNDISNAKVTSSLPSYVKWNNIVSPNLENITYDEANNIITWNVGSVAAKTGYTLPKREAAFQVTLTPTINQVGSSPNITNETTLEAVDSFAGASVKDVKNALGIRLNESFINQANDKVVE
ncbi:hypothetical protein IT397_01330, partial [Candidatus Nomurabacteria bacterium]|nr:hypothetical protein [Candidatus Nomurabacteria bacterium]